MFRPSFWKSRASADSESDCDSTIQKMTSFIGRRRRSASESMEREYNFSSIWRDESQGQTVPGGGVDAKDCHKDESRIAAPSTPTVRQSPSQVEQQAQVEGVVVHNKSWKFTLFNRKRQCQVRKPVFSAAEIGESSGQEDSAPWLEKLDITELETPSVKHPWGFHGEVPQSIFRVDDQQIALNLSIAESKCRFYKTELKETQGCSCHPKLRNPSGIQTVKFPVAEPSWCDSIRLDMAFSQGDNLCVCVRVSSRDVVYAGFSWVSAKVVQRHIEDGGLMFVDELEVKCSNTNNHGDLSDSIVVSGSFAWKLAEKAETIEMGSSQDEESDFTSSETHWNEPETPKEPVFKVEPRASIEAVCNALHGSRAQLRQGLRYAEADERVFLDQYNKFVKELQRRTRSKSAGSGEQLSSGGSSAMATTDLKIAKDDAWRQKKHTSEQRRRLIALLAETEAMKCFLESLREPSAVAEESETIVVLPCPSCSLSIQCALSR